MTLSHTCPRLSAAAHWAAHHAPRLAPMRTKKAFVKMRRMWWAKRSPPSNGLFLQVLFDDSTCTPLLRTTRVKPSRWLQARQLRGRFLVLRPFARSKGTTPVVAVR